jgi:NAD(P)H-hydrate epimerase
MKIMNAIQMRNLDRRAIEEAGIPGVVLMENAGRAVYEEIEKRFAPLHDRLFSIFCGTGNNGGDGYVLARHLKLAGADVRVQLSGDPARLKGDAAVHYNIMLNCGIIPDENIKADGILIDALLGTGAKGAPSEDYTRQIRRMNETHHPIISIDIPSGVDTDTGEVPGEAIRAAVTVSFAFPKPGLLLQPGSDCAGEIIIRDIGFDWESLEPQSDMEWIRRDELMSLLPARPKEAHKGNYGHLLIIGGSQGMSGAPSLTAMAALRSGVGLVTVASPESAQPIIASRLWEAMTIAASEKDGAFYLESAEQILPFAQKCDAVCLGPGISRLPEAVRFAQLMIREISLPLVIDADALYALSLEPDILNGKMTPVVLTPHPGEAAMLLGVETRSIQQNRVDSARKLAAKYHAVVVLKGAGSLITFQNRIAVNTTGNPGMAAGGSGDVLTGIIGALLARKMTCWDAARLGVFLHGLAGDAAKQNIGEEALIAGDIIQALPSAHQ